MKRTGSMASWVGPAVTRTFLPARSFSQAICAKIQSTRKAGSGSLPLPSSPQARCPLEGSMILTPRSLRSARLACVAGCSYILVFMAGETRTGQVQARSVVESMSSAMPHAILAMILAVAGAMIARSAFLASEICSTSMG